MYIIEIIKKFLEGDRTDYEKAYISHRYAWHWIHIPIITIILVLIIGSFAMLIASVLDSSFVNMKNGNVLLKNIIKREV